MRTTDGFIWEVWNTGGPFIGDRGKPHGRVTVEPDWFLVPSAPVVGAYAKGPIRSFQRLANDQVEVEVPNILTISIHESIDQDAATCTITMLNQSAIWAPRGDVVGNPGFYSPNHGATADAASRWGQSPNTWKDVLVPNALLRTYEGYGGNSKTIAQAIADGNILLTGLWLVDEVRISSDGILTLECRNMAKLLLDQILFPPLVPESQYPVSRCRWHYEDYVIPGTPTTEKDEILSSGYGYCEDLAGTNSSTDAMFGASPNFGQDEAVHGHRPSHAWDGSLDSYWYSNGNVDPSGSHVLEWIDICCNGQDVNMVYIYPWAGNYLCYVSVFQEEGGAGTGWASEGVGNVPFTGSQYGNQAVAIPYIMKMGIPWEEGRWHLLPRTYKARKIRLSFTNLTYSPDGPNHYRCGVRRLQIGLRYNVPGRPEEHGTIKGEGNYRDYTEVVKDVLLWAGFWLRDAYTNLGEPAVYGNIENTGIYSDECINDEVFDKKPAMDVLTVFKQIVGYLVWVDSEGAARFESPNWWGPGNFLTTGQHTLFIPDIDERMQQTQYTVTQRDRGVVSEILISSERPVDGSFDSTVTTRLVPASSSLLRGIQKPFGWVNALFQNRDEQRILAELVAMHIFFQLRQGSVSAAANPHIAINDQVRIWERSTSETHVHYVRGVTRQMDLKSGRYTMTLTTHWLGDGDEWVLRADAPPAGSSGQYFRYSARLAEFLRRSQARSVVTSRLNRPGPGTVVGRS